MAPWVWENSDLFLKSEYFKSSTWFKLSCNWNFKNLSYNCSLKRCKNPDFVAFEPYWESHSKERKGSSDEHYECEGRADSNPPNSLFNQLALEVHYTLLSSVLTPRSHTRVHNPVSAKCPWARAKGNCFVSRSLGKYYSFCWSLKKAAGSSWQSP